jgi:pimeloyl-ACP methyl ester carboxylesterase
VCIAYTVRGSGPAILLSHGFAASSRMFAANVDALADQHTVVTWDLRGHGDSDYPADPSAYSPALAVGDMAAVLDTTGASSAVLAGHSLGGYLSLEFHLAHPDRVEALVLIDTGPGYRRDEPRQEWNRLAERYADAFATRGLAALGGSEELRADVHRDASGLVHAARGTLPQHDTRVIDSLPSIKVPTLVVVGTRDEPFLDSCRYLAAKIPSASLVEIPDAGHAPNVSQAATFNTAVSEFLQGLRRSVSRA